MSFLAKKWAERKANPTPKWRRLEHQILAVVAFFSISAGLWENFRQLWLETNDFAAPEVSNILSLGMFIGVAGIMITGKFVRMAQIKNLVTVTLMARLLNFLALYCLNFAGNRLMIDLCIIIDVATAYIIITSMYPLLTTVMKSNTAYSRRRLVEYLFRDAGIAIGGVLIGHQLGQWFFDYNGCLLVAAAFLAIAIILMYRMEVEITARPPKQQLSIVRLVMNSKVQRVYAVYNFLSSVSFMAAVGLKMLVFTNMFDFSASAATNCLLVVGLIADLIGILALKFFTPKNDYVTMTLKFGIRLIAFVIAAITNNPFICFIAFIWALLSSTAYENISDGYYINAIDNRHQLKYSTFRHVVSYLGEAVGMFICGRMYDFGLAAMLGLSAAILVVQMGVAYYLIFIRQRDGANDFRRVPNAKHKLLDIFKFK